MRESETFGSEKGSGEELVQWLNDEAIKRKMKFIIIRPISKFQRTKERWTNKIIRR